MTNLQDGNKVFTIQSIQKESTSDPLDLSLDIKSQFKPRSDVFVKLNVGIDSSKHVNPLSVKKVAKAPQNEDGKFESIEEELRSKSKVVKTLPKYSYYEASNNRWIKCLIDVPGIQDHPKDKIEVRFTERTLDVILYDYQQEGTIAHFGCRKLHCKTQADKNKWAVKGDGIQVSLRKVKESDNWWSFFKQKATGEVDSEED